MSEMSGENGQDTGTGAEDTSVAPVVNEPEGGDSLNPAWNDLMSVVPSQLHSQVTPFLKDWDKNYQDGINKVHSQYEPYKPYLEQNIAPEQINYALQLMQAIETRPADVISALQEYAGISKEEATEVVTGGQGPDESEIPDFLKHPEVVKMQQMLDTMAQILVQQGSTAQQQEEDKRLASELTTLHEKFDETKGQPFDEEWVLTKAYNNPNIPLEKHVEAYYEFVNGIVSNVRKPGPKVMDGRGIAPDNQLDTKSLDDKGRRGLVAQMLQAAQQNNG